MKKLRILSYNIHKGFSFGNAELVIAEIKQSIRATGADIVFLQEVIGHHREHAGRHADWPVQSQFEYLADEVWPHFAYGQNAVYSEGHHGNAILSRFPITKWDNEDISLTKFERRGLLHASIQLPESGQQLDLICLHLNLFGRHRHQQVQKLIERISAFVPVQAPLIIAGDFNDWLGNAGAYLAEHANLQESFHVLHGEGARTFPSWLPILRLDRIYTRELLATRAEVLRGGNWSKLSDHLPILVEVQLSSCRI